MQKERAEKGLKLEAFEREEKEEQERRKREQERRKKEEEEELPPEVWLRKNRQTKHTIYRVPIRSIQGPYRGFIYN